MTEWEKLELAVRRVADDAAGSPFQYWFRKLADRIAEMATRDGTHGEEQSR